MFAKILTSHFAEEHFWRKMCLRVLIRQNVREDSDFSFCGRAFWKKNALPRFDKEECWRRFCLLVLWKSNLEEKCTSSF